MLRVVVAACDLDLEEMKIADVGSGYEIGFYTLLVVYLIGMAALATRGMVSRSEHRSSFL